MTALEQRVYRTADGRHVLDEDLHAETANPDTPDPDAVLAYAIGDDVPADVIDELDGRVSELERPAPAPAPDPAPPAPVRGSRIRVWATDDGRHVHEGDPAAAVLVYTEEDDVPADVRDELDAPARETEAARVAEQAEAERLAAEEAARVAVEEEARRAAEKAAQPAANKAAAKAPNK